MGERGRKGFTALGAWFLDADGGGEGGFVAYGARAVVAFCLLDVDRCDFLRGGGQGMGWGRRDGRNRGGVEVRRGALQI